MKRKMATTKRTALLLAGAMAIAFGGCGFFAQETASTESVTVADLSVSGSLLDEEQYTILQRGDISVKSVYEGMLSPYVEGLYFTDSGTFLEYTVALGEYVSKGTVLAKTDTTQAQEMVDSLTEQIADLTDTYNYQIALKNNTLEIVALQMEYYYEVLENTAKGTTDWTLVCQTLGNLEAQRLQAEFDISQLTETYDFNVSYLKEQLTDYQAQVSGGKITAPYDGRILQLKTLSAGDKVDDETEYIVIADESRYLAVGEYVMKSTAAKAQLFYAVINGISYEITYQEMDSDVYSAITQKGDTAYSTYTLETEDVLSFGQYLTIVMQTDAKEDVLLLPASAVKQDDSQKYCYRQTADGGKERVNIETGLYDGINYEVLSGLEEGDVVYIE